MQLVWETQVSLVTGSPQHKQASTPSPGGWKADAEKLFSQVSGSWGSLRWAFFTMWEHGRIRWNNVRAAAGLFAGEHCWLNIYTLFDNPV